MVPETETIYNLAAFLNLRVFKELDRYGQPLDACVLVDATSRLVTVGVIGEADLRRRLVRAVRRKVNAERDRIAAEETDPKENH